MNILLRTFFLFFFIEVQVVLSLPRENDQTKGVFPQANDERYLYIDELDDASNKESENPHLQAVTYPTKPEAIEVGGNAANDGGIQTKTPDEKLSEAKAKAKADRNEALKEHQKELKILDDKFRKLEQDNERKFFEARKKRDETIKKVYDALNRTSNHSESERVNAEKLMEKTLSLAYAEFNEAEKNKEKAASEIKSQKDAGRVQLAEKLRKVLESIDADIKKAEADYIRVPKKMKIPSDT